MEYGIFRLIFENGIDQDIKDGSFDMFTFWHSISCEEQLFANEIPEFWLFFYTHLTEREIKRERSNGAHH